MPDRIAVGRINATWGLRGHVKVTPYTSNPARFEPGALLLVNGEPRRVLEVNTSQGYPIIKFEGFRDATGAEQLRNTIIEIDEADLAPLPEGEFYRHDLIGLEIVGADGAHIGKLQDVLTTGANDVYVIRREGKPDALIPAIAEVVLAVDLAAQSMTINPMAGLLD